MFKGHAQRGSNRAIMAINRIASKTDHLLTKHSNSAIDVCANVENRWRRQLQLN
jgi:hypothetical protein